MSIVDGCPPPPPDKRPFLDLVKIRPGQRLQFFILSDRVLGVQTHYADNRTGICPGDDNGCKLCRGGYAPRWYGYLAVSPINHIKGLLLPLTEGAYNHCPQLVTCSGSLRGKVIACERKGNTNNSALVAELHNSEAGAKMLHRLPNPVVKDALCRLWSLKEWPLVAQGPSQDLIDQVHEDQLQRDLEAQDEPETQLAAEEWRRLREIGRGLHDAP